MPTTQGAAHVHAAIPDRRVATRSFAVPRSWRSSASWRAHARDHNERRRLQLPERQTVRPHEHVPVLMLLQNECDRGLDGRLQGLGI
jgi:hypothetical protein